MVFDWGNAICVVMAMGMYIVAVVPFAIFLIAIATRRNFKER